MIEPTAKRGSNAGNKFWGCSRFPRCRAIVNFDENASGQDSSPNEGVSSHDNSSGFKPRVDWYELSMPSPSEETIQVTGSFRKILLRGERPPLDPSLERDFLGELEDVSYEDSRSDL